MDSERGELRSAGRAGLWIGCFGWLIGLTLVTFPDTPALAGPLVGGAAITAACALGLEALWRHAPRQEFALLGGIYCITAVIVAYYAWIVEPSVRAVPGLVDRLAGFGARVDLPLQWAGISLLIGAPALLAGLHRRPQRTDD